MNQVALLESSLIPRFLESFSDEEDIRQKTKPLFSTAKCLLKMDVDNVCLGNIHASILVGNLCGAEGEPLSEGLFFGKCRFSSDILEN
jgi:hypothetical protein